MPSADNQQGELLEVLEFLDALIGMGEQDLRVLLEHGGDRNGRNVLRNRVEALQRVRAHEEVELAREEQQAVVHLRTAGHDRHVEAVLLVRPVRDRLIEAAVLGLGHPVGAERDLVELLRLRWGGEEGERDQRAGV